MNGKSKTGNGEGISSFSNVNFWHEHDKEKSLSGSGSWWVPTSLDLLRNSEKNLISNVKQPVRGHYVHIGGKEENTRLWTLSLNEENSEANQNLPLVLVHGMGSGAGAWALNLGDLATHRPVHAMDVLGFGQSSRPMFSCDATEAENELVSSLEKWRKQMKLERFFLLGHSFGGFLVTAYAIKYPNRVAGLILADPWGFPVQPVDITSEKMPYPFAVKVVDYVLKYFYPYSGLRGSGLLGPVLVRVMKPGLAHSFKSLGQNVDVCEYLYHSNAQPPSGEIAFHSIKASFGWAKNPMAHRLCDLHPDIPMTFIYGGKSWVDQISITDLRQLRPNSRVEVEVMLGAGHQVYSDDSKQFNRIVSKACEFESS